MKLFKNILLFICIAYFSRLLCAEKRIVVVVPSFNNERFYENNLQSIFQQLYDNYHVIYIDDGSSDNTCALVEQYVVEQNKQNHITIIKNDVRRGALYNHYTAVHMCNEDDIVINLDGDDWLAHEHVLTYINKLYENPDVWMTWGSYLEMPSKKIGSASKQLLQGTVALNAFRELDYRTSHLRTFYAGLFKQIKLHDLLYEDNFFTAACDLAFMMPMLEMAGKHAKYVEDVLYCYNVQNPQSHHRKRVVHQLRSAHVIRARKRYTPLQMRVWEENKADLTKLTVHIFASDLEKLAGCIRSIMQQAEVWSDIVVLHSFGSEQQEGLDKLQKQWGVRFISVDPQQPMTNVYNSLLKKSDSFYTMMTTDEYELPRSIDLLRCICMLYRTKAYGFYAQLSSQRLYDDRFAEALPCVHLVPIHEGIYAWQYKNAAFTWSQKNSVAMAVYKTSKLQKQFQKLTNIPLYKLLESWKRCPGDIEAVGLCL